MPATARSDCRGSMNMSGPEGCMGGLASLSCASVFGDKSKGFVCMCRSVVGALFPVVFVLLSSTQAERGCRDEISTISCGVVLRPCDQGRSKSGENQKCYLYTLMSRKIFKILCWY